MVYPLNSWYKIAPPIKKIFKIVPTLINESVLANKEIVELIRAHNNANILCIPARFTAIPQAIEMVKTFLNTEFEGGRHQNRIDKIPFSC